MKISNSTLQSIRMQNTILTILICLFASPLKANDTISPVVNLDSCSKMMNTTHTFIVVLKTGDDVLNSISQCAQEAKLKGASISGLGQLHNPTLAYFTSDAKEKLKTFPGYYELTSINGNISINGKKYYTHAHVSLADKEFHGITGHLMHARVGITAEITVVPFSNFVYRTVDAKTGFGPLVV